MLFYSEKFTSNLFHKLIVFLLTHPAMLECLCEEKVHVSSILAVLRTHDIYSNAFSIASHPLKLAAIFNLPNIKPIAD